MEAMFQFLYQQHPYITTIVTTVFIIIVILNKLGVNINLSKKVSSNVDSILPIITDIRADQKISNVERAKQQEQIEAINCHMDNFDDRITHIEQRQDSVEKDINILMGRHLFGNKTNG